MNWKTSDEVAEYFSKFDTGFNAKEFKTELKNAIDAVVKNCNIPPVVGRSEQLICHYCGKYKRMQGNGIMHQLCECGE